MRDAAVYSFPRSGQHMLCNLLLCFSNEWIYVPEGKRYSFRPSANLYESNEPDLMKYVFSAAHDPVVFHRTHNLRVFSETVDNTKPIPEYIHLVRDPRDVLLSYAEHVKWQASNKGVDYELKDIMMDMLEGDLGKYKGHASVQYCNWGLHCIRGQSGENKRWTVKYEDMVYDPVETVARAIWGLSYSVKYERKFPKFQEFKSHDIGTMAYNVGSVGRWEGNIDSEVLYKLVSENCDMMHHFGYQ